MTTRRWPPVGVFVGYTLGVCGGVAVLVLPWIIGLSVAALGAVILIVSGGAWIWDCCA